MRRRPRAAVRNNWSQGKRLRETKKAYRDPEDQLKKRVSSCHDRRLEESDANAPEESSKNGRVKCSQSLHNRLRAKTSADTNTKITEREPILASRERA